MSVSVDEGVVGVAWCSPEAWAQLKAIPEARIEKSCQDFVRDSEAAVHEFAARGFKVEKVLVDVGRMIEWCHCNGYEIDAMGRSFYGTVLLMARDNPNVLDKPIIDEVTRGVQ